MLVRSISQSISIGKMVSLDRGYNLCEVIIGKFIFNVSFSAVIKRERL